MAKLDRTIFDQAAFARLLSLERKRTDRSCRPFLLLLLEFQVLCWDGRHQRRRLSNNVIASLKACTRQTDMLGWYKHNAVIGVIYTELRQEAPAVEKILQKVDAALRARLTPEQFKAITVSAHVYPRQDTEDPGPASYDGLYCDPKQKKFVRLLKRLTDILGSIGLLVLFAPVLVVVGVAIKSTSKGPTLFKQPRLGQFCKSFTFLKFRSMYVEADSRVHEEFMKAFIHRSKNGGREVEALKQDGLFKLSRDPRVTPVGHFIRKTSLDELPQLFHVLVGTMSLVGPRPPIPYEIAAYEPWYMRRLLEAKPGITGLWQVQGRSHTTFEDMIRLDLRYIDEWSIRADIKLLLQTPWVVLKGKGAQ